VDVDHREAVEHVRPDEAAKGDHDAELRPDAEHVGNLVAHGDAQPCRHRLDRRGGGDGAPAAASVGLAHDEGDVVAGPDESLEADGSWLGRPEKGHPGHGRRG